jgi:hypothetical protein
MTTSTRRTKMNNDTEDLDALVNRIDPVVEPLLIIRNTHDQQEVPLPRGRGRSDVREIERMAREIANLEEALEYTTQAAESYKEMLAERDQRIKDLHATRRTG